MRQLLIKVVIITGFVLIFLVLGEIAMRKKDVHKNYGEISGFGYTTYFGQVLESHLWLRNPNDTFRSNNEEFDYPVISNKYGFREKEIKKKDPTKQRWLFFGDSYCEGVGAPYDSTWPRAFEYYANKEGHSIEVLNLGTGGSDVLYATKAIEKFAVEFEADVVVVSVNSSDYYDLLFRGGKERFHADGTTHFRKGPNWEGMYKWSRLFRVYIHDIRKIPKDLNVEEEEEDKIPWAANEMFEAMIEQQEFCRKQGIKYLSVIQPFPSEPIRWKSRNLTFQTESMWHLDSLITSTDMAKVNLMHEMQDLTYQQLVSISWPIDGHYRPEGYLQMGKYAYDAVKNEHASLLRKLQPVDSN